MAPGVVPHHLSDRTYVVTACVRALMARFRAERGEVADPEGLAAYAESALSRERADRTAARACAGLFAEAVHSPARARDRAPRAPE